MKNVKPPKIGKKKADCLCDTFKKAFLIKFNDLKHKINGEVIAKLTAYSAPQGIYNMI